MSESSPSRGVVPAGLVLSLLCALTAIATTSFPGVNEAHYWCKAKQYWNPGWLERDFFLQSPPAHVLFYATFGLLTEYLALDYCVWLVRGLGWCFLASGLNAALREDFPVEPARRVLAGVVFLTLEMLITFSGEWVVGGSESKVIAYGFLLWGLAYRHSLWWGGLCVGCAISFHPLVGLWAVLAWVTGAVLFEGYRCRWRSADIRSLAYRCGQWLGQPGVWLGVAASLPGILGAYRTAIGLSTVRDTESAAYIQVFYRLAHHLDPMSFHWQTYAAYGTMLVCLLATYVRRGFRNERQDWLWPQLVLGVTVIAFAGLLLGWGPRPAAEMAGYSWRMQLLKFYPFRLFDVVIPLAIGRSIAGQRRFSVRTVFVLSGIIWCAVLLSRFSSLHSTGYPQRLGPGATEAWREMCVWIKDNTPANALCQTPTSNCDFKWFAARAEYVSFKDCPQNAAGIVEWNRRLIRISDMMGKRHFFADEKYTAEELAAWHEMTGIDFIVEDQPAGFDVAPCFRNEYFSVYPCGPTDR